MFARTVVPVILCGGTCARLWPLSRKGYPKQFWPLLEEQTMLQQTVLRATGPGFAPPIVVAIERALFILTHQIAGMVA